jgi:hypothetical protein
MKERENYGTMEEATPLSTKEIHDDQGDHGGRGSFILISMISPFLAGSSGPRICWGGTEPW